jgi:hypothetical protein
MRHAKAARRAMPFRARQMGHSTIHGRRRLADNGTINCSNGNGRSRPNWQSHEKIPTLMRGVIIGSDMQARRNRIRASQEY